MMASTPREPSRGFPWPLLVALAGGAAAVVLGRSAAETLVVVAAVGLVATGIRRFGASRPVDEPEVACEPSGTSADAESVAELARTVADLNPDALVLYTNDGQIVYANLAARELFFEGRDPACQNFLRLLGDAPAPLREALLGESDRLFAVEVERQHETYHLTRRGVELAGVEHTLLVLRHLTREVARREVATLKSVVRVISHEVNNSLAPIASLVNSARMIADKPEHAKKLASVFDTIEERALHLKTFLEGYAGLARLPAPRPARVSWSSLFDHLRALHPRAGLPEPPGQAGWFDPVQVEQVLINLLKNAVEAGSPDTEVSLQASVDPDGSTRLDVLDRGPGFNTEALSNALLPFYTTKEHGSGMGLALCREVVEAHGGSVSLSNRPDGGARVSLVLPGPAPSAASLTRSRVKLTLSRT